MPSSGMYYRNQISIDKYMFERLIKLVRQTKVSLFIGAGFSIEANAPSVSKLKELVLAEFENDKQRKEHENDSLAELTEFL